jgi:hypothetical protein
VAFSLLSDAPSLGGTPPTSSVVRAPHDFQNRWRQYLQRQDFTPIPGPWQPPVIDLEAWRDACSPSEELEVTTNLHQVVQVMAKIPSGLIGGHWQRSEQQTNALNKAYPNNHFALSVRDGFQFQLDELPRQGHHTSSHSDAETRRLRVLTVLNWRKRGICTPISAQRRREQRAGTRHLHFILLFLVQKNGKKDYDDVDVDTIVKKWRGCLSATDLNEVLHCGKFKQHSEPEIDANTPPGCFQCRSDVSDAYNQLGLSDQPIAPTKFGLTSSRDLSCFNTGDPELIQDAIDSGLINSAEEYCGDSMSVVWFGARPSPFYWQKSYSLVLNLCRREGCQFSTVMDDNKLHERTPVQLSRSLLVMTQLHRRHGIVMSTKEPEAAIPKQVEMFNGSLYDSSRSSKFKSQPKLESIAHSLTYLIEAHRASRRSTAKAMSSALGKLSDASKAMWGTNLFVDGLQKDLNSTLVGAKNYHVTGTLSDHTIEQLLWWLNGGCDLLNGRSMIHGHPVDQVLSTDWCSHGWGAVLEPTPTAPNPDELSVPLPASWHGVWSGWGETLVGMWAVMAFARRYGWHHILICLRMDNIAAICYLNKMGSKIKELNKIMYTFLEFCKLHHLMVIASYIPGLLIKADAPSRRRASLWDCSLRTHVLRLLEQRLCRGQQVTFDLFATHMNTKAPEFASLLPDPQATWIDCLSESWQCNGFDHLFYAFPPPNQIAQLLAKVEAEQKTVLLVLPAWPRLQMARLAHLMIELPVTFPMSTETLEDPHSLVLEGFVGEATPPPLLNLHPSWFLAGYLLSGKPSLQTAAQLRWSTLSSTSAASLASQWLHELGPSGPLAAPSCTWIQQLLEIVRSSKA